jgi:hypothetical protein
VVIDRSGGGLGDLLERTGIEKQSGNKCSAGPVRPPGCASKGVSFSFGETPK